jgi:hypothetical protein
MAQIFIRKEESLSCAGSDYVMSLMHSRTWAHLAHLSVTGPGAYEAHKALNAYYDGIVDLVDRLVETAQGCYGEILQYGSFNFTFPPSNELANDFLLNYFESLKSLTAAVYPSIEQPALQNIVAEISELICGTLYQLRFLK